MRASGDVLFRSLADAYRADLVGRTVWTLTNLADGFGDATVSVARIWKGRMNAHAHAPGGEFMYVAAGGGRMWIEGLPLRLARHGAALVPPGLLHNAENTRTEDLVIVGITAPGVVPGSYAEVAPILQPTGRLSSVEDFACIERVEDPGSSGARVLRLEPPGASFPVAVRTVMAGPAGTDRVSSSPRIWVALAGHGTVAWQGEIPRHVPPFATVVAAPDTAVRYVGTGRGLRLLELSLPVMRG